MEWLVAGAICALLGQQWWGLASACESGRGGQWWPLEPEMAAVTHTAAGALRGESYSLGALTGQEIPVVVLPLSLCTSQQRCLVFLAGQGFFLVHPELQWPDLFRLFPHLTLVLSLGLNFRV